MRVIFTSDEILEIIKSAKVVDGYFPISIRAEDDGTGRETGHIEVEFSSNAELDAAIKGE